MLLIWVFIEVLAIFAVSSRITLRCLMILTYDLLAHSGDIRTRVEETQSQKVRIQPIKLSICCSLPLRRLRKSTGDERYYAPLDRRSGTLLHLIAVSCYRPFGERLSYGPSNAF